MSHEQLLHPVDTKANGIVVGIDEVKNLARTDAKVFFTARDLVKGDKVRDQLIQELKTEGFDPEIEVIEMELTRLESVRKAAEEFKSKSDALNLLVANAGEYCAF